MTHPADLNPRQRTALLATILVATFLLYIRTAAFAFVYDDMFQVVENTAIRSWSSVAYYFTSPLLITPYYRPLFSLWLRINDALFGLNPAGWHVTSILAHLAATALSYFVCRRLAGDYVGLVAAALFGVHPIHIESVVWVSGVCDPLSAAFLFAAFLAYLKAREAGDTQVRWVAYSCFLSLAAMLCKEPAVVLPALVFAHACLFDDVRGGRGARALRHAAPFVASAAGYLLVRYLVLGSVDVWKAVDTVTMLISQPAIIWFYVSKLIFPVNLSVFYDLWYVYTLSPTQFLLPLGALVVVAVLLRFWGRRSQQGRVIAFAGLWFLITLLPALYIRLLPYGEIVHDRYLYAPSLGFCLLVGVAVGDWLATPAARKLAFTRLAVIVAVLVVLCGLNLYQQSPWRSNSVLYQHGFRMAPRSNNAENNYARLLTDEGRFEEAVPHYQAILRRDDNYEPAHYNLGYTYYRQGQLDEARAQLQRAVILNPNDSFAHMHLGLIHLRRRELPEAEQAIRRAIAITPDRPGFHLALSFVLESKGDLAGALAETREELLYSPASEGVRTRAQTLQQKVPAP